MENNKGTNIKRYDLEERTLRFAGQINALVNGLSRTNSNMENGKQLIRSAGSVGANYIEANEALSKKDFIMRVKIARKEAKESRFWLSLIVPRTEKLPIINVLINEATELIKIFSSILLKCGVTKY
ncbi:four helix bundle protein [Candidatus Saganbacteria bacterium]|nr:four helix bundle protein [Candidatus Saganbacteria bacterium]